MSQFYPNMSYMKDLPILANKCLAVKWGIEPQSTCIQISKHPNVLWPKIIWGTQQSKTLGPSKQYKNVTLKCKNKCKKDPLEIYFFKVSSPTFGSSRCWLCRARWGWTPCEWPGPSASCGTSPSSSWSSPPSSATPPSSGLWPVGLFCQIFVQWVQ